MELEIKELKKVMTRISLAVEKTKLNPKSGWIEIETKNNRLNFKVSNYDYYLETSLSTKTNTTEYFHTTILAETFIPLIAKLEVEKIDLNIDNNALILNTENSSYTFPIIKEGSDVKFVDKIEFTPTETKCYVSGSDLSTIATTNAKGLLDAVFMKEIQQFIYVDEKGAITFTENIYVNEFRDRTKGEFQILLNSTQAKLLEIFDEEKEVELEFERKPTFNTEPTLTNKVKMTTDNLQLILITQSLDTVKKFPNIKLRELAKNEEQTHIVLDKKELEKALNRLMIFDKKFDVTVMDYSKIVFKEKELELISIKNKNKEIIPYKKYQNTIYHESIIRFADLLKQLKALTSNEIDISYGSRPAIVINGNVKQLIPEILIKRED